MFHRFLALCLASTAVACGNDGSTTGTQGGATGGVGVGGSTTVLNAGGSTTVGGRSNSTAAGGNRNSGGASSQTGTTLVPGSPCTGTCPTGTVLTCFGDGCPLGPCDESRFFASALCSTVYTSPLDSSFVYCTAGETSSYCLVALNVSSSDWVVRCNNGTPTLEKCAGGCGTSALGASC
jgi:hypothetical protein